MEHFDVIIAGGGIAGSTAAKFLAKSGLKVLFVERYKTPRNKPCSGIQFKYFEKILGEKIPKERLCNVNLKRIKMYLPNGKSIGSSFEMLNFMRKPFDDWLNIIAQDAGAEFRDELVCQSVEEESDNVIVSLIDKDKTMTKHQCRYFVDATGLRPKIRAQLRPQDFKGKSVGATLNYYIDGEANLDPETLYQFWNLDWNNAMFAWIYKKTLDDNKDYWVVGTGYNHGNITEIQELFYNSMKEKFKISGEIIKKEGYSSSIDMYSKDRVWLGQNRILMVGDAAGLVDQVRGVGMDAAALSGRLLAKAISRADKKGTKAIDEYTKLMKRVTSQTIANQQKEINVHENNEELQRALEKSLLKTGMNMFIQTIINKFRSPEKQKLLPP